MTLMAGARRRVDGVRGCRAAAEAWTETRLGIDLADAMLTRLTTRAQTIGRGLGTCVGTCVGTCGGDSSAAQGTASMRPRATGIAEG